jgi:carbonic anhydrase/acetyltransferase-like protein (isoleucine patch superfamily)
MTVRPFLDKHPDIAPNAYIDETALVIGDVSLGEDSSVWPMAVIRGDVHAIRIGRRTNIQDGSVVHGTHDSEYSPGGFGAFIGENVTIGHRAIVHACHVGDYCLIGMGAIVMDGARIGNYSIIGAGSLVPAGRELEGGYLYVGKPAQQVRPLNEKEMSFLDYSAEHYVRLKNTHLRGEPLD